MEFQSNIPIYLQIMDDIKQQIVSGDTELHEGDILRVVISNRDVELVQSLIGESVQIDDKEWQNENKWEWVETRVVNEISPIQTLVSEFSVADVEGNVTQDILTRSGEVYMICVTSLSNIKESCEQRLGEVVEHAMQQGAYVVCITPEPLREITWRAFDGSEPVRCYNIDATVLKTMLRAENGLVVLNNGVIDGKYNCRMISL